jgi:cytochrome c5
MSKYIYQITVLFTLSVMAFCGQPSAVAGGMPARDGVVTETAKNSWRERRLSYGKSIYESACASCHDQGINGAPAIGDQNEWSKRSPLWLAVLFEHAKVGYLGMPPKGGSSELTDLEVDAAGEYMLSVTFPKLPLD